MNNGLRAKKVFISGPMNGYPNFNREAFAEAEERLKKAGFSVFNPAKMDFLDDFDNDDIMAIDLAALSRCNAIYQLPGWKNSKGAYAEYNAALWAGLELINESWLDFYVSEKEKMFKNYLDGGSGEEDMGPRRFR